MKKMIVTGASSFIGKRLIAACQPYWDITAVVRSDPGRLPKGIRSIKMKMDSYAALGQLAGYCDCFVHLAWDGTRGQSRMDAARQQSDLTSSLSGIRSMLDAGCKKVILAGSQAEYGPHTEKITEQTICRPNTEYGKAKLALYRQAAALCEQAGALCVEPRFFSLYGPGDEPNTMVIATLRRLLRGEDCLLTEGVQMWDYLYIDDAITALAALCREEVSGGVYNFGSGDVRPLRDYVKEMAAMTGGERLLQFGAVPYPPTGMVSLWPDVSRLKQTLNWEPETSFADGIREILSSMRKEASVT